MSAPPAAPSAPGGPAVDAHARGGGLKGLDRPIRDVYKTLAGALPFRSYSPASGQWWPGGQATLTQQGGAGDPPAVDMTTIERLMSALGGLKMNGDDARGTQAIGATTIRDFRSWSCAKRLSFINAIWDAATTAHDFNRGFDKMSDPAGAKPQGVGPLPTSWCPTEVGAKTYHKRLDGQPFRNLGVGFRVDGSDTSALARVLTQGMRQQRLNETFMKSVRGLNVTSTVASDDRKARVWTGNHDIFNETGVCLSRNFFGGTAFPERMTNHKGAEYCVLWAVRCQGLHGFDTEAHQNGLAGSRQWRPGEKAFREVPPTHLIGWVKIQRRGEPQAGGWRFDIADDANWNFVGTPSVAQRTYIIDELNAWRGKHEIPAAFDFAT